MLQTIRDRTQGVIVGVIVVLISLTFILWGVESYISAARRVIVAEVGKDDIGQDEYQRALQRFRRQAESMLGENFNAAEWNTDAMKQKALDQLIEDKVLGQVVDKARLRLTDAQVARELQALPAFQDDKGQFSRQRYEQQVGAIGFTQIGFESQMREDMAKAQLRTGIAGSEFVTSEEGERIAALKRQRRDVGYAIIPATAVDQDVKLTDDALNQYYEAHKEEFRTPEKASFEYVELAASALVADVAVDDEKLHQYYESNQAQFTLAEERNVNHILVQVSDKADAATVAAAEAKAKKALERARAGESFEALAKELSDDTGSKAEGGETGMFPRGAMAPEFEDAAFKLTADQISDLVRTKFGFHVIKLKAVKEGGLQPFDKVKAEIESAYRAAEAQKAFFEQAEHFSNLVYEHPDSLAVAAEKLGAKTQHTAVVSKEELGKLFSEKVANAAFASEVLSEGMNSEPAELGDGRVMALRVVEHVPSAIPPLADVKAKVDDAVRNEQRRELTAKLGHELIERLRKGETPEQVLAGRNVTWQQADGAKRDGDDVNRAVLRAAFSTDVPGKEPVFTGVAIGIADYALIKVANVAVPAAADVPKSDVASVQRELARGRMGAAWADFLAALRARSDVKTYPKNL